MVEDRQGKRRDGRLSARRRRKKARFQTGLFSAPPEHPAYLKIITRMTMRMMVPMPIYILNSRDSCYLDNWMAAMSAGSPDAPGPQPMIADVASAQKRTMAIVAVEIRKIARVSSFIAAIMEVSVLPSPQAWPAAASRCSNRSFTR
jgi:hypothetical protein